MNNFPADADAEDSVIGCAIHCLEGLGLLIDLNEEDFSALNRKIIFLAIKELHSKEIDVSIASIFQTLKAQNRLDSVGGINGINNIYAKFTPGTDINFYFSIVKEKSARRRGIKLAFDLDKLCREESIDIYETCNQARAQLLNIEDGGAGDEVWSLYEIIMGSSNYKGKTILQEMEEIQNGNALHGILKTGFQKLDDIIYGLMPGQLIILAARPGCGKTTLALNICENIRKQYEVPILIFSGEVPCLDVGKKILSSVGEIKGSQFIEGPLSGSDYRHVYSSGRDNKRTWEKVFIYKLQSLYINKICNMTRRLVKSKGVRLLVIDYLGQVHGSGSRSSRESRAMEISEISRTLKELALELQIPILCLSQLNRNIESRTDNKPLLSDLRDSGSVEQDADVVAFISRRELSDPLDKPGMAQISVSKNRKGKTKDFELRFRGEYSRFESLQDFTYENVLNGVK